MSSLTESQKKAIKWIVEKIRAKELSETFKVSGLREDRAIFAPHLDDAQMLVSTLYTLAKNGLLVNVENNEVTHLFELTGEAYKAVDSNFAAPDSSFLKHLTPLADVTNLDKELKERCLPILGAGNDSKHWDIAVRQAFLILEERLRSVSGLPASEINTSETLVNKVFGESSTLITDRSKRTSYRNLYSGVFTTFRNQYSHRFVDPLPEDGGAIITFVNLLLKMLDDLRPSSTGSNT
jgi:hypothetical protein